MKKDRDSIQFKYERTYTLRHPKFKLFQNVQYLDAAKLSKGSHTIELGKFEGGNCDCAVTAKISNGVIKGFNYPQCENAKKIPPKEIVEKWSTKMERYSGSGTNQEFSGAGENCCCHHNKRGLLRSVYRPWHRPADVLDLLSRLVYRPIRSTRSHILTAPANGHTVVVKM
jgi:hypothetical protein